MLQRRSWSVALPFEEGRKTLKFHMQLGGRGEAEECWGQSGCCSHSPKPPPPYGFESGLALAVTVGAAGRGTGSREPPPPPCREHKSCPALAAASC